MGNSHDGSYLSTCAHPRASIRRVANSNNWGGGLLGTGSTTVQDPHWAALKNAYRISSGIIPKQGKGAHTTPSITSAPTTPSPTSPTPYSVIGGGGYAFWPSGCTNCTELTTNNWVLHSWEPGNGSYPNFGPSTATTDDASKHYSDSYFYDLCGPGAADVALQYWPAPPNLANYSNVRDPWTGVTTTWNGTDIGGVARARGYMAHLAWQIKAPSWSGVSNPGMLSPGGGAGVNTPTMQDALNWEASGENTSTWSNYYYLGVYASNSNAQTLHNNVVFDLNNQHAPVVVMVNAQKMPNWTDYGGATWHWITILGYNDDGGATSYGYTDTCGKSTNCNTSSKPANTDGGPHTVSASTLWNAIYSWVW